MISWLKSLFKPKPISEQSLMEQIEAKRKAYLRKAERGEIALKEDKEVIELKQQLSAYLTKGALPCRDCGNLPHGMKRRSNTYEVGCIAHMGLRWVAKAPTPEEAVMKWNKKNI
jgi:hypothetical protein